MIPVTLGSSLGWQQEASEENIEKFLKWFHGKILWDHPLQHLYPRNMMLRTHKQRAQAFLHNYGWQKQQAEKQHMVNPVIDERAKKSYCQTNKKTNAFFPESHELNTLNNKEITMLESSK